MTGTWLPWVPWLDIYLWGLWVAAVAQTAFVAVLATTRWRHYRTGRAIFIKSLVLAVLLDLTVVSWYGWTEHLVEIGAVLICVMAAAICYLLWSVVRQKVLDRRGRSA